MSKKPQTVENQEKVVTKYDLKMQKREEAKKQAAKEEMMGKIYGTLIVLAVLAFVLSFPIRNYLTINGTYVKIANEKVTRVEFDYNYNLVKNNYISQYSYYMSMFGIDLSGDLSNQMYTSDLTWQDYFEQVAAQNIAENKALRDQAKAEGFTYDTSADYADYLETLKSSAKEAGTTEAEYVKQLYGTYATVSRVKKYVEDALYLTAFYNEVYDRLAPSDEDITAYYNENADNYDSVDFYILTVSAELPTAPTELADEGAAVAEDGSYTPSDAEVEYAMSVAKAEAEAALGNIATAGDLRENYTVSSLSSYYSDWLLDAERKAGDTTVIENSSSNEYYALSFQNRYLDQTETVDLHIIVQSEGDGQAIIDEYNKMGATEENFATLADKYNDSSTLASEGGVVEGYALGSLPTAIADWIRESKPSTGDVTAIVTEGSTYVVYFTKYNDPSWKVSIRSTVTNNAMTEYIQQISEGYEVENTKNRLKYLEVEASEAAAAAESTSEE